MPWLGLLVAAWLVVFFVAGLVARWAIAGGVPLTTAGWVVVLLAAALLASASTMGLAAGRWRQHARQTAGTATVPVSTLRSELRLGNGYLMLAAGCALFAVLLVLLYRIAYTI